VLAAVRFPGGSGHQAEHGQREHGGKADRQQLLQFRVVVMGHTDVV